MLCHQGPGPVRDVGGRVVEPEGVPDLVRQSAGDPVAVIAVDPARPRAAARRDQVPQRISTNDREPAAVPAPPR